MHVNQSGCATSSSSTLVSSPGNPSSLVTSTTTWFVLRLKLNSINANLPYVATTSTFTGHYGSTTTTMRLSSLSHLLRSTIEPPWASCPQNELEPPLQHHQRWSPCGNHHSSWTSILVRAPAFECEIGRIRLVQKHLPIFCRSTASPCDATNVAITIKHHLHGEHNNHPSRHCTCEHKDKGRNPNFGRESTLTRGSLS